MQRLDDVVGPGRWSDEYEETPSGRIICRLGIQLSEDDEWMTYKSDGAGATGFEAEKGAISDAFKRAAVKWGIGRYLYDCKAPWVELENGKYLPRSFDGRPYLPKSLPADPLVYYNQVCREHRDTLNNVTEHLANGEIQAARDVFKQDLDKETQILIYTRATTKGGYFTTEERAKLKGENDG